MKTAKNPLKIVLNKILNIDLAQDYMTIRMKENIKWSPAILLNEWKGQGGEVCWQRAIIH